MSVRVLGPMRKHVTSAIAAVALVVGCAASASAAERHAVVVTGAAGGPEYAQKYERWQTDFVRILRDTMGVPAANIVMLAERADESGRMATAVHVRSVFRDLATRVTKDDVVLVLLIGHGTGGDGDDAKFNLVGPDLTAEEWAGLVRPIAATVVFVNAASGSFPFLETLAGRGRIVITAADSPAQQFETVFPGLFIEAFEGEGADTDKDRRVSIWEAFVYAGAGVRTWFEQRGQLATERPLLDDSGDGVGAEAPGAPAPQNAPIPSPVPAPTGTQALEDGKLARTTFLQAVSRPANSSGTANPGTATTTTGTPTTPLEERRVALTAQIEALRMKKEELTPDDYERQLEALLLELAMIDRSLRR